MNQAGEGGKEFGLRRTCATLEGMTPGTLLLLSAAGLVAGFIDSIAGGGGLITLPALALVIGPGVAAVATNKIVGSVAALVALAVYLRHGHFDFRRSAAIAAWVAVGAWCGSRVAPGVPPEAFKYFLMVTCPVILWVVWKRELWVTRAPLTEPRGPRDWKYLLAFSSVGFACGFYDGIWGPGGGTFMFLALLFVVRMPMLTALAAAKFANACSASTALVSFALAGHVHWAPGFAMAGAIGVGAFIGANLAARDLTRVIRPVLTVVAALLLVRLIFGG